MDLMIQSTMEANVDGGLLLHVTADDLAVQAYVVIATIDLAVVERLVPTSVFQSGVQVHVAGVQSGSDISDEVVGILENMSPQDVVVYLCEDAIVYGEVLAVLGIKH
jgi:hypothetical protein